MLESQPMWPSREDVNCYIPECFCTLYPTTRVIIDCVENHVQTPSSLSLQSQLYSSYQSNTTLKGLVRITPYVAVSPLFLVCILLLYLLEKKNMSKGILTQTKRSSLI